MSIDRDSYEPITGNPRRNTGTSDPDDESNEASEPASFSSDGSPSDPKGDEGGPNGDDSGTNGGPQDPTGAPKGSDESTEDPGGDPSAPEGAPAGTHSPSQKGDHTPHEHETGGGGQGKSGEGAPKTGGRKRRVKVTPKDWDTLEQVSSRLGIGYATVYRIAFQQFVDRLEDQEAIS